jgi:hypothetical protein
LFENFKTKNMASNKKAPIKKAQSKVVQPTVVKKEPKAIEPLKGKDKPTKKEPCDTVVAIKKADQQQVNLVRKKPLLSDEIVSVHAEKQVEEVKEDGDMLDKNCLDFINKTEAIVTNGYYHRFDNFCLITYNSGNQKNLNVYQTVNMLLGKELSELLGIDYEAALTLILICYHEARRFDTLDILQELEGCNIIVADRDKIVCANDMPIAQTPAPKQNTLPEPLLEAPKPTVLVRAEPIHHPNVLQQQPEFKSLISEDSEVKEDVPQHKHEDLFKAEKREHGSPLPF